VANLSISPPPQNAFESGATKTQMGFLLSLKFTKNKNTACDLIVHAMASNCCIFLVSSGCGHLQAFLTPSWECSK